jgi:ClpX C4-type zinc finger
MSGIMAEIGYCPICERAIVTERRGENRMVGISPATPPCSFCGERPDEVRRLVVGTGVGPKGNVWSGALCSECIGIFMMVIAHEDRECFDKLLKEARVDWAFKPETGEPQNSN